jgi:hypothetical protein
MSLIIFHIESFCELYLILLYGISKDILKKEMNIPTLEIDDLWLSLHIFLSAMKADILDWVGGDYG